jgi:hypothetical protein
LSAGLVEAIRSAFRDVRLGAGIGLREGNAIDDYASADERKAARALDETEDWQLIPVESLNQFHYALSYFDAEGMRFHLPAFLIADLRGELSMGVLFNLTQSGILDEQMRLLSPEQRDVVRQFLVHCRADPDRSYDHDPIDAALAGYWAR